MFDQLGKSFMLPEYFHCYKGPILENDLAIWSNGIPALAPQHLGLQNTQCTYIHAYIYRYVPIYELSFNSNRK